MHPVNENCGVAQITQEHGGMHWANIDVLKANDNEDNYILAG